MNYIVRLSPHAERNLDKLHGKAFDLVREAIDHLATNPRPDGCLKMKGRANEWRIRAGAYRLVYAIDDESRIVRILEVGHRRDVYKK